VYYSTIATWNDTFRGGRHAEFAAAPQAGSVRRQGNIGRADVFCAKPRRLRPPQDASPGASPGAPVSGRNGEAPLKNSRLAREKRTILLTAFTTDASGAVTRLRRRNMLYRNDLQDI